MHGWMTAKIVYNKRKRQALPLCHLKMLTCAIDAKENRYIIVTDIPGAFLHADMEGTVHLILEGEVAESIMNLEPTIYTDYT